jgi:hypothetical protein
MQDKLCETAGSAVPRLTGIPCIRYIRESVFQGLIVSTCGDDFYP